ncbi:MAG: glycosyltransferase family 4 protein, partial [Candidatus Eisenbacteria bacterium]
FLGSVDDELRREEYARADLFAAPATHGESFGIVLLEALAAGLPVLASSIPGYRDVLEPSNAGRTAPPGDVDGWAEGLETLIRSADLRCELGARGTQYAERYSWAQITGRIENVYQLALAREGRRIRSGHSTVQVVPERSRA